MATEYAGYAYLANLEEVKALALDVTAQVMQITKKRLIENTIAVPQTLKPADTVLSHILFALKHEGVNLQILSQALPLVSELEMREAIEASPTGKYIRSACFLWEYFTGETINTTVMPGQNVGYHRLFDPSHYITTQGYRNTRWRVVFNGLGSLDYCVTVRKTAWLMTALGKDSLSRAKEYTESLDQDLLNRALSWAYLSETKSSYAIEREVPDTNKTHRFVNLLRQAHQDERIDEDYLVRLQNETISNVFHQAASFRNEQNHLSNGPGAAGITYVPPDHHTCRNLMEKWLAFANDLPNDVNPIVLGGILSFGFVFIHPFMDGNGRLSRFVFHKVLCQQGGLSNGLILPVSAVLRDREQDYLRALVSYSEKTLPFWDIDYIDVENVYLSFTGSDAIYRYWDGTACVELLAEACEEALEQYIKREVAYLSRFESLKKTINDQFDVPDKILSRLVMFCLDQKGRLSQNRRDQYQYEVPSELFDEMENAYLELFGSEEETP